MRDWIDLFEQPSYRPFTGFGGRCGQAAVAINRAVFGGRGKLVGAFNEAFYEAGRLTGHVAVFYQGSYWDSDARPKSFDEIESWGMLDTSDPDYEEFAIEKGIEWNDETASKVARFEMTEDEALEAFGKDQLDQMMRHLGWERPTRRI